MAGPAPAWQPERVSSELVAAVTQRYLAVNGEHPMTPADDAYVREHFVEASEESLRLALAGQASLPAYLLSDGTPMVPPDHLVMVAITGDPDRVRDWFGSVWPGDEATGRREWETYLTGRLVEHVDADAVGIMRVQRCLAQARAALEVLLRDPRDDDARASLWEAVNGGVGIRGLDQLLRPTTAYDRLRLGTEPLRTTWVDGINGRWFSPAPAPLPVRTQRLVLRAPRQADAAELAPAYADPDFVEGLLTGVHLPAETDRMIRRRTEPDEGPHRVLTLVIEHEGHPVGDMLIMLQGVGLLSAELGWTIVPWAAGRGIATEAATAAMEMAFTHYGVRRVTASLDAANERSAALAERLGMVRELDREHDFWSKGRWTSTYEYGISREQWRSRLASTDAPAPRTT